MVYFQISRIGFNCGYDKNDCNKYPNYCMECVKIRIREFGLVINENMKVYEMDSEEKRIQMFRDLISQKFLDVLNLRHILLMSKESGLPIVNYPISFQVLQGPFRKLLQTNLKRNFLMGC